MELSVKIEELRRKSIFVATPMYGGQCLGLYAKSCLDLQALCMHYGVNLKFSFLFNESLIQRGRNYLADEFMRSDCTHLMFIDADILFDPNDVIALLALDKDIGGGPYPKKQINWTNIHRGVSAVNKDGKQMITEDKASELEGLVGDYVFNLVHGTQQFSVTEPFQVMEIGTGFMMIKREVFVKFQKDWPEFTYKPDHIGQPNFDGSRMIHAFFHTPIDRPETSPKFEELTKRLAAGETIAPEEAATALTAYAETRAKSTSRYLSEDYFFCQWARKIGFEVWLCPWMKLTHVGTYPFRGDMPQIADKLGRL